MRSSAFALLGLASCAPPQLAPEPERVYPRKIEEVWSAAMDAVQDFGLAIESAEHDSFNGRAELQSTSGARVTMHGRSVDADRTSLSLRILPDDPTLAGMILDRVSTKLGTRQPPPTR